MYGSPDAERILVFERRKPGVVLESFPEERVADSEVACKLLEVDELAKVVADVQRRLPYGRVVRVRRVVCVDALEDRRHERGGLERERVGPLCAGGLDLRDELHERIVEPAVWRQAYDRRVGGEEGRANYSPEDVAADADVRLVPAGLLVRAVAVPLAGV